MKDQLFSGRDVPEAVAAACRALGLAEAGIRYVVLERGAPGALGSAGTPARIAVLLDRPGPPPAAAEETAPPASPSGGGDPRKGIETILRTLAQAAAIEIRATAEETDVSLDIRLAGPGVDFFLEEDGEVLRSLEHLLQRMYGRALAPRRLSLDCEGGRLRRDEALRAMARALAAAVNLDGVPRTTRPLNAYERRVVHVAVGEEAGLRTFSVGEGADRRVTVAPAEPAADRG